jgi:hypothetical protein
VTACGVRDFGGYGKKLTSIRNCGPRSEEEFVVTEIAIYILLCMSYHTITF